MRICRVCSASETDRPFVSNANLCVECKRSIERARYHANREKRKTQAAAWRDRNREYVRAKDAERAARLSEEKKAYVRQWRIAKGDAYLAERRADRAARPEHFRAQVRERRKRDPEAARSKARAQYQAHRDRHLTQNRRNRLAHLEARKAAAKRKRARDRDRIREAMRAYYRANKERFADGNRRRRALDPERGRLWTERRRARKKLASDGTLTLAEWKAIVTAHHGRCAYCGSDQRLGMDHLIPLSRGGEHSKENVAPACQSCNSSKRTRTPLEWFIASGEPRRVA